MTLKQLKAEIRKEFKQEFDKAVCDKPYLDSLVTISHFEDLHSCWIKPLDNAIDKAVEAALNVYDLKARKEVLEMLVDKYDLDIDKHRLMELEIIEFYQQQFYEN